MDVYSEGKLMVFVPYSPSHAGGDDVVGWFHLLRMSLKLCSQTMEALRKFFSFFVSSIPLAQYGIVDVNEFYSNVSFFGNMHPCTFFHDFMRFLVA